MYAIGFRTLVLIILTSVTFSSCQKAGPSQTGRTPKGNVHLGGTVSLAISTKVDGLLPEHMIDAATSEVGVQLHAGLLALDPQSLEIIPAIAESWSVSDDGSSYVFKLRRDVKFHDDACFAGGARNVTANDFAFSFKKLCSAGSKAFASTFGNRVVGADAFYSGEDTELKGVVVIDDFTMQIQLLKPDPSFLYVLAGPAAGVISEKALNEYGEKCRIGAGPFRFVSDQGAITLARNTDFFNSDPFGNRFPYLDTVRFVSIENRQEQLKAFFDGDIDLVEGLNIDPVREILDLHISDFSGAEAKFVMERDSESIGSETYTVYRAGMKGLGSNFLGYRDFSRTQIEQ